MKFTYESMSYPSLSIISDGNAPGDKLGTKIFFHFDGFYLEAISIGDLVDNCHSQCPDLGSIGVKINGEWCSIADLRAIADSEFPDIKAEVDAEATAESRMARELSSPEKTGRI